MVCKEWTKFWRADGFEDLELLRATYITHSFAPHFHEGYAIGIIERGVEEYRYRGSRVQAEPGSMVVINPGEIHTGNAADARGWTYRMTYPGVPLLRRIAAEIAGGPRGAPVFRETVIHDAALVERFRALHIALEDGAPRLERDVRVRETYGLLIRRYAEPRRAPAVGESARRADPRAVSLAREYLHERYMHDVSLGELAGLTGASPFHLARVFRRQTGLPPHRYLNVIRVQQARRLLRGGLPIAEVALATGFADQSHLTRWFKRIVGVAPGGFVKVAG